MDARERQDALVGWLRAVGAATVSAAAQRFAVTERTIHRDLERLRARDIVIATERGRGGGIRIDPERSATNVRLTLDEVVGLALAVSLARRSSSLPFGRSARHGLHKLLATLPRERARGLDRLLARVLVGAPASSAVVASLGMVRHGVLDAFESAFHEQRALAFSYDDRHGATSRREVEPHGLLVQTPAWYVLAYDLGRAAPRMFRLDRMGRPNVLARTFAARPLTVFTPLLEGIVEVSALGGGG